MCVTTRRPAGGKNVSRISPALGAANVLTSYIMCAPYIKHMCVTTRRPAGGKAVSQRPSVVVRCGPNTALRAVKIENPPAPTGHTAVKAGCSVLVSLLSRHPAISVCSSGLWFCFLGSPVLSSLFSVVLLKTVGATDTSRLRPRTSFH